MPADAPRQTVEHTDATNQPIQCTQLYIHYEKVLILEVRAVLLSQTRPDQAFGPVTPDLDRRRLCFNLPKAHSHSSSRFYCLDSQSELPHLGLDTEMLARTARRAAASPIKAFIDNVFARGKLAVRVYPEEPAASCMQVRLVFGFFAVKPGLAVAPMVLEGSGREHRVAEASIGLHRVNSAVTVGVHGFDGDDGSLYPRPLLFQRWKSPGCMQQRCWFACS